MTEPKVLPWMEAAGRGCALLARHDLVNVGVAPTAADFLRVIAEHAPQSDAPGEPTSAPLADAPGELSSVPGSVWVGLPQEPAGPSFSDAAIAAIAADVMRARPGDLAVDSDAFFFADTPSTSPCAGCGGVVFEFSVPNWLWNSVVRRGGPEGDREYLCAACFHRKVAAQAQRLAKLEEECNSRRDAHYKLSTGIKAALGLKNWPEIPGNFQEGVGRLVTQRLAEVEAQAAERRELLIRMMAAYGKGYMGQDFVARVNAALASTAGSALLAELAALRADESLLVELFRSPEFEREGRDGDHDNLRPCQTAVRVLKALRAEVARLEESVEYWRKRDQDSEHRRREPYGLHG